MENLNKKIMIHGVIILVILLISQTLLFYFVNSKFNESIDISWKMINETESKLKETIYLNKIELQTQVNSLTDAITSVSSAQIDLNEQLSEIKAKASSDFSGIIEQKSAGVVTIRTDVSQGTGFLISEDGYIVTNAHVLAGASLANVYTSNNKKYPALLVGYSPQGDFDIALLKIDGSFSKLEVGDSDNVKVGEKVVAIGNPLGLSFTVTEGIISARDREGVNRLPYYFQTDASLNPGNSGGPLINTAGDVIGINNFKVSGADNIGFALEINRAIEEINEIAMGNLNQTIL